MNSKISATLSFDDWFIIKHRLSSRYWNQDTVSSDAAKELEGMWSFTTVSISELTSSTELDEIGLDRTGSLAAVSSSLWKTSS